MQLFARKVNNYDLYASQSWCLPGWRGMFILLALFTLGTILASLLVLSFRGLVPEEVFKTYYPMISYVISFIPPMIYASRKSMRESAFVQGYKLNSSNFGEFKWWQIGLITIVLTFAMMMASDFPNYLNFRLTTSSPFLKEMYDEVMSMLIQMTGGPLWVSFLLTAVFAPIFEEWLCRGMILRGLLTRMKPGWAIVVSALFFAFIHMNPWQALNAFIIGLIMGYVYFKTGSLWLTMLIHFVNNATSVISSHLSSNQDSLEYFIDLMPLPAYIAISIGSVAILVACLYAFKRIPLKQPIGNIDAV